MSRALAVRHVTVAAAARVAYLIRLAERRARARAGGYNCWAFERDGEPGRFVEFVEAAGRHALDAALTQDTLHGETLDWQHAPAGGDEAAAIYVEVELP